MTYEKLSFHLLILKLILNQSHNKQAMSRVYMSDWQSSPIHRKTPPSLKRHTSLEKLRLNGQAKAVLM